MSGRQKQATTTTPSSLEKRTPDQGWYGFNAFATAFFTIFVAYSGAIFFSLYTTVWTKQAVRGYLAPETQYIMLAAFTGTAALAFSGVLWTSLEWWSFSIWYARWLKNGFLSYFFGCVVLGALAFGTMNDLNTDYFATNTAFAPSNVFENSVAAVRQNSAYINTRIDYALCLGLVGLTIIHAFFIGKRYFHILYYTFNDSFPTFETMEYKVD